MTTVAFPKVERPLISIVMVTYGGFDWVVGALRAVADHTDPCYEVIIVDNASPDDTGRRLLDVVAGATIVVNDVNVGFGAGANQGALRAIGRHLFFLNSDAFVRRNWLPPLLAALDRDPGVGAVVSRLVDPDGTLQEAGGLVGAHGYAGQLGMGDDATRPEYRFRRQVDFGSGAALLVRRAAFLAAGGFHPAFLMGYFEDVDLCLDLARQGLRTVYEPASVVSHLRGASTAPGEAETRAMASHSVFVDRWSDELDRRPPLAELDAYPHRLHAARDFVAYDRILFVTTRAPDEALLGLVQRFADLWPTSRLTVLLAGELSASREIEALLDSGVEVARCGSDPGAWLTARRFHYTVVAVDGGDALDRLDAALDRTQPHTALVLLAGFAAGPVDVELAGARAADAVLCLSAGAAALVGAWAGSCRGPVVAPDPPAGALVDVMAGLGMAPPQARV